MTRALNSKMASPKVNSYEKNYALQIDPGPTHIPLRILKKICQQPTYDNCDNTFAITVIHMVYVLTYDFAALAQQSY